MFVTNTAGNGGHGGNGGNSNNTGGAGGNGGGVYSSGTLTLISCTFASNTTGAGGGGGNGFGSLGLGSNGGAGGVGGGVYSSGALTLISCTFASNAAGAGGGGGRGGNGSSYSFPSGAPGGPGGNGGNGGALYSSGTLTLTSSTIASNAAGLGGAGGSGGDVLSGGPGGSGGGGGVGGVGGVGGGVCSSGALTLTSCTFASNAAGTGGWGGYGGYGSNLGGHGIGGYGGNGGAGGYGGGLVKTTNASLAFLRNSIISLNNNGLGGFAGSAGGGFSAGSPGGNGPTGSDPDMLGPVTSEGHNLLGIVVIGDSAGLTNGINGDLAGTTNAPINPLLGPLAANGGPTLTMALLPGSPAIDAGDDSLAAGTDQRGDPRKSGLHVDIGAYEQVTNAPPMITQQPANQAGTNGGAATFTVGVSGSGPVGFRWYFSNTNLQTVAGGYAQMISGFVYGVVVTNPGSGYTTVPHVSFLGGGGVGAAATATVSNGIVAAVGVTNAGTGYTTLPTVVIDPPNGLLPGQTNSSLMMSGITTNNAGNYFVIVTNAWGAVTSTIATLTVFLPPQNFVAHSSSGHSVTLNMVGTPNYPYALQTTTNLRPPVIWIPVMTNSTDANGNWQFTDTNLNSRQKFYRTVGQ